MSAAGTSARAEYRRRSREDRQRSRQGLGWSVLLLAVLVVAVFVLARFALERVDVFFQHEFGVLPDDTPARRLPRAPLSPRAVDLVSLGLALFAGLAMAREAFGPRASTLAWRRGAEGEEQVGAMLDRLSRHGFLVRHDLAIVGSKANVDHVVLDSCGLVVIDTKNFRGKVTLSKASLWHGRWPLDDHLRRAAWEADRVAGMLWAATGIHVPVQTVVCVLGAELPRRRLECEGVVVVQGTRALRAELKRGATRMTALELSQLERALEALPARRGDA